MNTQQTGLFVGRGNPGRQAWIISGPSEDELAEIFFQNCSLNGTVVFNMACKTDEMLAELSETYT